MNNNQEPEKGTTNTTGWYTKDAKERVTSEYEKKSKTDLKSIKPGNEIQSRSQMDNFMKARKSQMSQARRKKKSTDFNANNYDIEELAAILKFEYIPLNKGVIQRRIFELKRKFAKQPKYQKFFDDAQKLLLKNLELYNKQTWVEPYEHDESKASQVLQNQFLVKNTKEVKDKTNQIINQEKNIIGRAQLPINRTFATKNAVQGKINGMLITETKRIINFDSHYRQILDPSSVDCENLDYEANLETRLYNSSNYIVNLNTPLTNVIDITVDSVEIPNAWYTFSSDYGTNQFTIIWKYPYNASTATNYKIAIENGNYSKQQLVIEINKKIFDIRDDDNNYVFRGYFTSGGTYYGASSNPDPSTANPPGEGPPGGVLDLSKYPFPILEFRYAEYNDKITIYNNDPHQQIATFKWYDESPATFACAAKQLQELPRPGGKVDYNFGWLMGFRQKFSYVYPYNTVGNGGWESNDGQVAGQSRTPLSHAITPTTYFQLNQGEELYYGKTRPKSTVDIKGTQYFIISLDDFNNNKPNLDLISLVDTADKNFKIPSYINTQTMDKRYGKGKYYIGYEPTQSQSNEGYACVDVADVGNNERACSTNDLNIDLSSNLTKAQKYTATQISLALQQQGVNRFKSPNSSDLLVRFSVNRNPLDWNTSIIYNNPDKELTKRKYFGPVKLSKFGVRLLNDKGFEVNLNDRDWSFSIIATSLYQY